MALSKFDVMWDMMSEHNFDFSADPSHKDLLCGICHNVMINSVLSNVCGCQYCHKCISEYVGGEDKYCPGGKEYCKDDHIIVDRNAVKNSLLNNKISRLNAKCPNYSCECNFELKEMGDHLRVCTQQPIECPYVAIGCTNNRVNEESIVTHLHGDTMNHSELLVEVITQLRNEVKGLKEDFASVKEELRMKEDRITNLYEEIEENERRHNGEIEDMRIIVDDLRREMKYASEKRESEIATVRAELLNKEDRITNLEEEIEENNRRYNGVIEDMRIMMDDLRREMKDVSEKSESEIAAVRAELLNKEDRIVTVKGGLRETEVGINGERNERKEEVGYLKRQIEEVKMEAEKVVMRMKEDIAESKLEIATGRGINNKMIKLCPNFGADFVWRIDGISLKKNTWIWSESFLHDNYKLCLSLYIHGGNIELYCYIMKGDNDDNVKWPMRRSISLNIMDQYTLRTHNSITKESNFTRPIKDRGGGIGSCWSYSSINNNPSVIHNDSILVSCVLSN